MCSLSSNLGDTRTIVTHPATTTHSKLTEEERNRVGISSGLIRISGRFGEHLDDIVADLRSGPASFLRARARIFGTILEKIIRRKCKKKDHIQFFLL